MDPNIVFDCEKVLPNRFGLALAAAARIRALNRGSEPRLRVADAGTTTDAPYERLRKACSDWTNSRLSWADRSGLPLPIHQSSYVATVLWVPPLRPSQVSWRGSTDDTTNR